LSIIDFNNELNKLSKKIIGAAIEVHKIMGPGLLETVYEECLCHELFLRGIMFDRQAYLPVKYKGIIMPKGFRLDILVEGNIIVEVKSVSDLVLAHEVQIHNYLKLSDLKLGLLINFNVPVLKDGIKRIVNGI
jgi:GxxExxY protein